MVFEIASSSGGPSFRWERAFGINVGGDEFVWVLPNTPSAKARQICERLQENLAEHDWSSLLEDVPLTVSVGIAQVEDLDSLEKLMGRADSNLFKAKKTGRSQIGA